MKEKEFRCVCGFKVGNKGGYIQHISECEKYKRAKGSGTIRLRQSIRKMQDEETDKDIGLGKGTRRSSCCNAPMKFNQRIGVSVCTKCKKSPWERTGMPEWEKKRRSYL